MTVTKNEKSASRGIWGIVLVLSGVLLALSIFSYEWTDIGCLTVPPNTPVHNWIGPVGAWAAFLLFVLLGVIAYAIPFWCLAAGVLLLISHQRRLNARRPLVASLVLLLALAVLVDLAGSGWTFPQRALNLADLCGLFGRLITRGLLVRWLSTAGATIVAGSGLVAAFIALVGSNTAMRACRGLAVLGESLWQKARNVVVERRERRRSELQDRRKADEQRLRIERTLKAAAQPAQAEKTETTGGTAAEQEAVPPTLVLPERKTTASRRRVAADLADSKPESKPSVEKREESATGTSYQLPPLSLLQPVPSGSSTALKTDTATTSRILVETLADFGIECEVTNVEQGPVVTRYELLPAPGIRIERISGLSNNLALALKATSVRVQTPIPGKGVVGVEVPNSTANVVYLREILSGSRWNSSELKIPLALGKDVGGVDLVADLTEMPHLLIAGATGSGKTVCLNAILAGLLLSRKPSELRLMLVDPKIVEFSMYEHLPHLVVPVITDAKKVPIALRWAINEMERRYKLFARIGVRNIESYNHRPIATQESLFGDSTDVPESKETPALLPYIVIVIDELADLMLTAQAEIESCIARLAQLSRAVGIHMILSTQRPSVNVITGTIKANFPARIAFQVAQKVDSRTILDTVGAEKLLGRGDMLFLPPGTSKLVRAQGAIISDEEIRAIVSFIREQAPPTYEMEIHERMEKVDSGEESGEQEEDEKLVAQAIEIIRETHRASTSSLQRRLRIGYTRAARIMDILEERGIVGPPRGSDPREILVDLDGEIPNTQAHGSDREP